MKPGAILYDRANRRAVILTGPIEGRYEVQRGKGPPKWVQEQDVAVWTTEPQGPS